MNLNREAFQKIHEVISAQPERLAMSSWEGEPGYVEDDGAVIGDTCGTTRCVAGWAVHFAVGGAPLFSEGRPSDEVIELARDHGLHPDDDPDDFSTSTLFERLGCNLLGLSYGDGRTLFYLPNDVASALVRLAARGDDAGFANLLDEYR